MEESVGWDRKSTVKERFKNHNLTGIRGRESFSIGGTPPDDLLLRKNPVLNHPMEILLGDGGPLPHLLRRGNFSHCGERGLNRCARSKFLRRRKAPNPTAARKTGATAEDWRWKQRKSWRRKKA